MSRRGSFERHLLLALFCFALLPSLLLLGVGAYVVSQAVSLSDSPAAWERVGESGRDLLGAAERSGDAELARLTARHRTELSASLIQARRWEYLIRRVLVVIPGIALLLAALLAWLAVRAARGIARQLAYPIRELVGWSQQVARLEPLPPPDQAEVHTVDEFGVLRSAFRGMADELVISRARALEAERMRSWVSMARRVAHELKNPLTPMRLAVRALERDAADQPPASREALEVIATESARLEELARSFDQFGRIPEGPPSEIDLREMLGYLLRTHLPPGVQPRFRSPVNLPLIHGHYDALSRAFANLILNAADAVGPAGTVTVKLTALRGEAVEIRIQDSGPGIPPEDLERIWEPDFTTKSRGTGLGLALVRQTVRAHGGHVAARNRPEDGAEFRVVLPLGLRPPAVGHQSNDESLAANLAEPSAVQETEWVTSPPSGAALSPSSIADDR